MRDIAQEIESGGLPWWEKLRQFCSHLKIVQFSYYGVEENVDNEFGEEANLIVRELITNALKHARPTRIEVQITRVDAILSIVVSDDGVGFNPETPTSGTGIRALSESVSRLNGSLNYDSGKGSGTTVFVDLPLPKTVDEFEMHGIDA